MDPFVLVMTCDVHVVGLYRRTERCSFFFVRVARKHCPFGHIAPKQLLSFHCSILLYKNTRFGVKAIEHLLTFSKSDRFCAIRLPLRRV